MIIPIKEILNNQEHYKTQAEVNISLAYQLEKVIWLSNKLGKFLDTHWENGYWYIANEEYSYTVDALLHNLSVLIEYYYNWIIFVYIGTNEHKKSKYRSIKKADQEIEDRMSSIFEYHNIGNLKIANSPGFYEECISAFKKAFEFLFVNEFHEVYVVNNFIKHNRAAMHYAPKGSINGKTVCIPFIYFQKQHSKLINPSVLRCFFDNKISEDLKIESDELGYHANLLNKTSKKVGSLGGFTIVSVLGIEYLIKQSLEPSTVGISIESIIELSQKLSNNIINIAIESNEGDLSELKRLTALIQREPKTITNVLKNC